MSLDQFNTNANNKKGLNNCGNFESLFSMWRAFIHEFAADNNELEAIIFNNKSILSVLNTPYWKTSFEIFFSDELLVTMFTSSAIQHAPKGSYPKYFQSIFESALKRPDKHTNHFMHHILFGSYVSSHLPKYLKGTSTKNHPKIEFKSIINSTVQDIESFKNYDLICLSNIFDWMTSEDIAKVLDRLTNTMKPGGFWLLRQLNNTKEYNVGDHFIAKPIDIRNDHSLFYNKITLYQKV